MWGKLSVHLRSASNWHFLSTAITAVATEFHCKPFPGLIVRIDTNHTGHAFPSCRMLGRQCLFPRHDMAIAAMKSRRESLSLSARASWSSVRRCRVCGNRFSHDFFKSNCFAQLFGLLKDRQARPPRAYIRLRDDAIVFL